MKILPADEEALAAAVKVLMEGAVAVIPTDTVYGLAALPQSEEALERLYSIKGRDKSKPIALLVSDAAAAERFIGRQASSLGAKYWPGALTLVSANEAVRVPAHDWTRRLIALCGGALRVTSANISGGNDAKDAFEALKDVGLKADIIIDGGPCLGGLASTVAKYDGGKLEILRRGPVEFLTLASASPRRSKILKDLGVDFTVVKTDAEEVSLPDDPVQTVKINALAKGASLSGVKKVLSADTIVWFNGRIYGKPRDCAEAKTFLEELSGNVHTVFTAVAYDGDVKVCESKVKFKNLTGEKIDEYIKRVNPLDRAGAYDIDESGDFIVESWTGSYENIMGLPKEPLFDWGIVKTEGAGR